MDGPLREPGGLPGQVGGLLGWRGGTLKSMGYFSSAYSGDSVCLALMVNDGAGGWVSPDSVDAPTEMSIRAFYSGVSLNLSSTWRLLTEIEGLTFAGGPLEVPQGGEMS